MSKSIWCIMEEDAENSVTSCLGCYESEQEADKAWEYWALYSSERIWNIYWIMQTTLYDNFQGQVKELEL